MTRRFCSSEEMYPLNQENRALCFLFYLILVGSQIQLGLFLIESVKWKNHWGSNFKLLW